jgi:hypothetical protein
VEERRTTKDRRIAEEPRRQDDRCARCELYREEEKKREAANEKDHDKMKSEMSSIWKFFDRYMPRWVFGLFLLALVGILGAQWVEVKNIGKESRAEMSKISDTLNGIAITQSGMMSDIKQLKRASAIE